MLSEDFLRRLGSLKDEVAAELATQGTHSRELSLALADMDSATNWVVAHGVRVGTHLVIDKREYARGLEQIAPTATVETS